MQAHPAIRGALAALLTLCAATPALATPDFLTVAPACAPANRHTVDVGLVLTAEGLIRAGRNPPPIEYICPVWSPDDFSAMPSWSKLKLQFRDANPGGAAVRATLYEKVRRDGSTRRVAVVSSTQSTVVTTASVDLPRLLDFSLNAYYIVLTLDPATVAADVHTVTLSDR